MLIFLGCFLTMFGRNRGSHLYVLMLFIGSQPQKLTCIHICNQQNIYFSLHTMTFTSNLEINAWRIFFATYLPGVSTCFIEPLILMQNCNKNGIPICISISWVVHIFIYLLPTCTLFQLRHKSSLSKYVPTL